MSENNKIKQENIDYNNHSEPKSHWAKYKLYYLILGNFFFTIVVILIINSNTTNEIKKLKSQLGNSEENSNNFSDNYQHTHEYSSEFIRPDSSKINENWIEENIANESVRKEVEAWINTFKYLPEYFAKEGPEIDKHVLLSGPPGTGKTYLAKTFCQNESLQYAFVKFDTVLWKGSSIAKQEIALNQAKSILRVAEARQKRLGIKEKIKPVVIVIDELDSVGIKDLSPSNSSSRDEVDGLLRMIDEINDKKLNIIIVGITNNPEVLDEALIRPGRLGRRIEVGYPTDQEMEKVIDYLEKEMKGERGYKFSGNEDKWGATRNDKRLIIKWPSNFWSDVRRIVKETRTKYSKQIYCGNYKISAGTINTGFTLRDLEKVIGVCLSIKSGKNVQEIVPSSEDFQNQLEKEIKKRINDMIKKLENNPSIPSKWPSPPVKEKDENKWI